MPIWDDILSKKDKAVFEKGRMGGRVGFGARPAVIVIDMARGFVEPEFQLSGGARPSSTIESIAKLLSEARREGVPCFFTTVRTPRNESEWGRWKSVNLTTNPELKRDDTWQIIDDLAPQPQESVIYKTRPSGFFGTDLANLLIYRGIDTVIITGMTTSGCVRAAVVDAFSYNFRVIVPVECVADRAELSHKVSLLDIHMKYGDVLPLDEVIRYLKRIREQGTKA
jgi:maleamate amidohydrolase